MGETMRNHDAVQPQPARSRPGRPFGVLATPGGTVVIQQTTATDDDPGQ